MGQEEVYQFLKEHPHSDRDMIAKGVGTNPRSIHVYLSKLQKWGRIAYDVKQKPTKHGRKVSYYEWYAL